MAHQVTESPNDLSSHNDNVEQKKNSKKNLDAAIPYLFINGYDKPYIYYTKLTSRLAVQVH